MQQFIALHCEMYGVWSDSFISPSSAMCSASNYALCVCERVRCDDGALLRVLKAKCAKCIDTSIAYVPTETHWVNLEHIIHTILTCKNFAFVFVSYYYSKNNFCFLRMGIGCAVCNALLFVAAFKSKMYVQYKRKYRTQQQQQQQTKFNA